MKKNIIVFSLLLISFLIVVTVPEVNEIQRYGFKFHPKFIPMQLIPLLLDDRLLDKWIDQKPWCGWIATTTTIGTHDADDDGVALNIGDAIEYECGNDDDLRIRHIFLNDGYFYNSQ